MACKKSELVSAINSYANARVSNDANLMNFAGQLLQQMVETLEFAEEEEAKEAVTEVAED